MASLKVISKIIAKCYARDVESNRSAHVYVEISPLNMKVP